MSDIPDAAIEAAACAHCRQPIVQNAGSWVHEDGLDPYCCYITDSTTPTPEEVPF